MLWVCRVHRDWVPQLLSPLLLGSSCPRSGFDLSLAMLAQAFKLIAVIYGPMPDLFQSLNATLEHARVRGGWRQQQLARPDEVGRRSHSVDRGPGKSYMFLLTWCGWCSWVLRVL